MREFVLTTPQGLKFRLRTAVSGKLVIKPASGIVLEDGLPADKIFIDVETDDGFRDAGHSHQRAASVATDATQEREFEDLLAEASNPAQIAEVAAEAGLKARDVAFGEDYVPAPPRKGAIQGYMRVPFNRIPAVVSTYETVDLGVYLGIYQKSLGNHYRQFHTGKYPIPGKILYRLLQLGYTTEQEYKSTLRSWDRDALRRYEQICKDRIASRKPGYLPDGQYPWRVADVHPPQLLPLREEIVTPSLCGPYIACLKEEYLYYHPSSIVQDMENRRAEEAKIQKMNLAVAEARYIRQLNKEEEQEQAAYEGKGKGRASGPIDQEPRGTVRNREEAEAEWALHTKKAGADVDARPMKHLRTQAPSTTAGNMQMGSSGAGPSNAASTPPAPSATPARAPRRPLGAGATFYNVTDVGRTGTRGAGPTNAGPANAPPANAPPGNAPPAAPAPARAPRRALGASATFANIRNADQLSTPGAGSSTGAGTSAGHAQPARASSVQSDVGSDAATEAGSDATEAEDDDAAPAAAARPRTTRPLGLTETYRCVWEAE